MITVKKYPFEKLKIDLGEIKRYAGLFDVSRETFDGLCKECLEEAEPFINAGVCFDVFPCCVNGNAADLSFMTVRSQDLCDRLSECDKVVLFAATVGIGIDRLTHKYAVTEPTRSLIMQAVGSAVVEAVAEAFCEELARCRSVCERYSCGYGDFELSAQKSILNALNCEKLLGVTLNDSLLMSPTKTVTAIVGLKSERKL